MVKQTGPTITRRRLVGGSSVVLAGGRLFTPSISRAADRPLITHGLQSGDVSADSGMVWARVSRPSRVLVEFATTESFKDMLGGVFADALPESDLTAKMRDDRACRRAGRVLPRDAAGPRRADGAAAKLPSGVSAPRRPTTARSRSSGPATPRARAGASTRPGAA